MAVPKRKTSPSNRGKRQAHKAKRSGMFYKCSNCRQQVKMHYSCLCVK